MASQISSFSPSCTSKIRLVLLEDGRPAAFSPFGSYENCLSNCLRASWTSVIAIDSSLAAHFSDPEAIVEEAHRKQWQRRKGREATEAKMVSP